MCVCVLCERRVARGEVEEKHALNRTKVERVRLALRRALHSIPRLARLGDRLKEADAEAALRDAELLERVVVKVRVADEVLRGVPVLVDEGVAEGLEPEALEPAARRQRCGMVVVVGRDVWRG